MDLLSETPRLQIWQALVSFSSQITHREEERRLLILPAPPQTRALHEAAYTAAFSREETQTDLTWRGKHPALRCWPPPRSAQRKHQGKTVNYQSVHGFTYMLQVSLCKVMPLFSLVGSIILTLIKKKTKNLDAFHLYSVFKTVLCTVCLLPHTAPRRKSKCSHPHVKDAETEREIYTEATSLSTDNLQIAYTDNIQ